MKLEEAQELSVSGVAVLGNSVMQDIIWPKGSTHPFLWITDGYVPHDPKTMRQREWMPLHPYKKGT